MNPNKATRLGYIAGEALRPPPRPLPLVVKEIKATNATQEGILPWHGTFVL